MSDSNPPLSPEARDWLMRHQASDRLELPLLTNACHLVMATGETASSPYTASMLQQGLAMADELLELNCDTATLAAAITFPAIYYQHPDTELVEKYLPAEVHNLVRGVKKMDAVQQNSQGKKAGRADNLRKMCLAMVDDVRIVLVKLAEQLVILKYLRHCSPDQQQQIAQQVMNIYAPLANRLALGK